MMLMGQIQSASVQDRDGALPVLAEARRLFPFINKIFADGGYQGEATAVARIGHWELEIVKRSDTAKGFIVLPKLKDPLIFRQCIHLRDIAVLFNRGSYVEQYDRRIEARLDAGEGCSELPRQCS
jgi:hypothetical protein